LILRVALDAPLRRTFDYLPPLGADDGGRREPPCLGVRVRVPFGRRQLIGILVGIGTASEVPREKLKCALEILDQSPVFDRVSFELLLWAAEYYHHPIGEVFAAALPVSLREGQPAQSDDVVWSLTPAGKREVLAPSDRRAPRQRALLAWLADHDGASASTIAAEFGPLPLRALAERGWVSGAAMTPAATAVETRTSDLDLTDDQRSVVATLLGALGKFAAHVLYGVTGSGKTEVYLRVIGEAIARGGQALVLVPEIALTPQLVERFRSRFSAGIAVLHSNLTGTERRDAWRAAHGGAARIVIGTRSALFTSLPNLALIVVDEEHDASYKQHEGFHYSARDLAVWRAQRAGVPIVLGSATPSLETLDNAAQGRYVKLLLPQRPGAARQPHLSLVDLRKHASEQGLSQPALQAIAAHLDSGAQVIVFLNRRGYAPTLFCNACGWIAPCEHCDARMTLHRRAAQLRCHHCGAHGPVPVICGRCSQPLHPVGQGTERVEETLRKLFPEAPLARLDRDTVTARGAMEAVLARVHSREAKILVGTQMLGKGHHFPDVSLVVILDADQGLFASDFRATERLAQSITQVAGRAGRAARAGEVLIQTAFPEHPLLNRLIAEGYEGFAASALEERRAARWPPYSRLALLRAEAKDQTRLDAFLREAAALGRRCADGLLRAGGEFRGAASENTGPDAGAAHPAVQVLGPAPALIARRADHFRAHLLIEAEARSTLQRLLKEWLPLVERSPAPSGLRWSIDVDPLEVD
jgi:primosomal protein N' (replication factor Y)